MPNMVLAILQARVSSTRLPGKVLKTILGRPMLALQVERILRSRRIDRLIIATSKGGSDDKIENLCKDLQIPCFRGVIEPVLDRYYEAAKLYQPDHVVRLTGDCPLIDPRVIDDIIDFYFKGAFDYASNTLEPTLPDGLDTEIFKYSVLDAAWNEAVLPSHREHVTPFLYKNPERFKIGSYKNQTDLSNLRWTVDEPEDFELVHRIYEALYPIKPDFDVRDILRFLSQNSSLLKINSKFRRNEGLKKSLGADKLFLKKISGE
jgi:spore coat polysaccharide biosynthesis protein SpsF